MYGKSSLDIIASTEKSGTWLQVKKTREQA